jgi:hypothetical protein
MSATPIGPQKGGHNISSSCFVFSFSRLTFSFSCEKKKTKNDSGKVERSSFFKKNEQQQKTLTFRFL